MDDLMKKLTDWGCDVEGAVERFVDDTEMYLMFVRQFSTDESVAALEQALTDKDYKKAFEAAHTLKGVSANLGLTPLTNVISSLVEDLRITKTDDLDAKYAAVTEQYNYYKILV